MLSKLKSIATHPVTLFAAGTATGLVIATTMVGATVVGKIAAVRAKVGI